MVRPFFFNFGHSTDANTAVSTVSFAYSEGVSGAWLQLQLIFLNPYYWFMNVWFWRARLMTTAELFEERLQSRPLAQFYALFQIGVAIIGIAFSNFVTFKVTSVLMEGGTDDPPRPVLYSGPGAGRGPLRHHGRPRGDRAQPDVSGIPRPRLLGHPPSLWAQGPGHLWAA